MATPLDFIKIGNLADRPTPPADPRAVVLYCSVDAGYRIDRWNGTTWERFSPSIINAPDIVEPHTEGVGAPYDIVSPDDIGKCLTNEGAGAEVYLNLPAASVGDHFEFGCQDAVGIRFTADGTDTISIADNVSAAGGFVRTDVVGSMIRIIAIATGQWFARYATGTWEVN